MRQLEGGRWSVLLAVALCLALGWQAGCTRDRTQPAVVAAPAVVMVIAADWRGRELAPAAAGSGVIVGADGTVLTSHHVLHDDQGGRLGDQLGDRLHDVFVIARFRGPELPPEAACMGHPDRAARDPALDLAVIRCSMDMEGRPFEPARWPAIALGRSEHLAPGQGVWILGYPRARNSAGASPQGPTLASVLESPLAIRAGHIAGWTGEHGGAGHAFVATDADIAPGISGGAAVDRTGALIGVATGYRRRTRLTSSGSLPAGQTGLIRPIDQARPLLDATR